MRRFLLLIILLLNLGVLIFSQSGEDRRFISVLTTALKESTGHFARDLKILSLGDEVILIGESGKWSQIRSGDLSGWVVFSSLSTRRIVASGTVGATSELSLAGKGFTAEMEVEYRKSGIDYSIVDMMENQSIPASELLSFITEGRLARGEF